MRKLFLIVLILSPFFCFSQASINQQRTAIIKTMAVDKTAKTVEQSDSTLTISIKKSNSSIEHFYMFDREGKCLSEKVSSSCEACVEKELKSALAVSRYKWKKINENQFASRFEDKLIIELPVETKSHFTILRTDWTRTLYDLLTGK